MDELIAELRAIWFWDRDYVKNPDPSITEKMAWAARRNREVEILRQLLTKILQVHVVPRVGKA